MPKSMSLIVISITDAWMDWNKLYAKTKDISLSYKERREACAMCESLNETISKYANEIDLVFERKI
jgi:hypothetical protein